jgi:hypothetical protein
MPTTTTRRRKIFHPNPILHRRKCACCHHPDLPAIEQAFLRRESAERIVKRFHLPSRSALYRHAVATGLLDFRRQSTWASIGQLIKQLRRLPIKANSVLTAITLHAQLSGIHIPPFHQWHVNRIDIPATAAPRKFAQPRPQPKTTPPLDLAPTFRRLLRPLRSLRLSGNPIPAYMFVHPVGSQALYANP